MSIIRTSKQDDPFARVNKQILNDTRLSWKAKGLLSYLMGKPDKWEANVKDLIHKSPDGRDAIYSGMKELRKYGYARYREVKNEHGQFCQGAWTIYDRPRKAKTRTGKRDTENPLTVNRGAENPDLSKKDYSKKDKSKIERSVRRTAAQSSGTDADLEFVSPEVFLPRYSPDVLRFARFSKKRGYHLRADSRTGYARGANEGGWNKYTLANWEKCYQRFISRIDASRFTQVLEWYLKDPERDGLPNTVNTLRTFIARFDWIEREMKKEKTGTNGHTSPESWEQRQIREEMAEIYKQMTPEEKRKYDALPVVDTD